LVAPPTELVAVKTSVAAMVPGTPGIVILTAIPPAGVLNVVVALGERPLLVAVRAIGGIVSTCSKFRMVAALAEVAIASEANPANAKRISEDRMVLLLPRWWKSSVNLVKTFSDALRANKGEASDS